jgi:uncharacterized LabA/DUF88 family protein
VVALMTMQIWRIDLPTASRKARLAFSIKCQRSATCTACGRAFAAASPYPPHHRERRPRSWDEQPARLGRSRAHDLAARRLNYNGYTVVTKATKEFVDASGRRKVKGNMDIELAIDAMELAGHIDETVLFSEDGDFRSLVEVVQRHGVRVTVVSTIACQPPMIADELRRQADVFTDLKELQPKIGRDPSERVAPREPRYQAPHFLQRRTTTGPSRGDDNFDD